MKAKSILLVVSTAVITAALMTIVPRLKTEGMRKEANDPWISTAKSNYNYPYESFVVNNHIVDGKPFAVCQGKTCDYPPAGTPEYISQSVASWLRFPQDVWEDPTTHPWQALQFIGVKPGDKVVDIMGGNQAIISMYWSRLFYHIVGDDGRVFPFIAAIGCRGAHVPGCQMEREYTSSSNGYGHRPAYTLLGDPRWNGIDAALHMEHTIAYRNMYAIWDVAGQFAIPQQANVVWSTGKWHAFHGEVYNIDMTDFMPRVFESITSGGELVIADYAGNPGTGFTQVDTLHRVDKEAVKAEVLKYGFVFDSESDLWAKKDDDHTKVVPEESTPGVADMFILKFKKPMNAPPSRRETREEMAGWLDSSYANGGGRKPTGTWHNADYTGSEGEGGTFMLMKSWYMGADGAFCERQEWEPITDGIIGCHYERDRVLKYKLGDVWEQRTEFATDDPNATGFRAPYPKALMPWHIYDSRPAGCVATSCSDYQLPDNIAYGHIR